MKSKTYYALFSLTALTLASLITPLAAQETDSQLITDDFTGKTMKIEEFSEYWIDYIVPWIILSEEMDEFETLQSFQDIVDFVERFWLKRDPVPETFYNEFKEDYYKRLRYVNANFGYGDEPGIRSHRGMVYSVLGEPQYVDKAITLPGSRFRRGDRFSRRGMIWVYGNLRGTVTPNYYQIVFMKFGRNRWEIVEDFWGQKSYFDRLKDSGNYGTRGYIPSRLRQIMLDKKKAYVQNDNPEIQKRLKNIKSLKLAKQKVTCSFNLSPDKNTWGELSCIIPFKDIIFRSENNMNNAELLGTAVINLSDKILKYKFETRTLKLTDDELKDSFDKSLEMKISLKERPGKEGKHEILIEIKDILSEAVYSGIAIGIVE